VACCYYLRIEDDEDSDFDYVFGFDDDAEVLNLVLETIGEDELSILI
jgi:hypothetical protein